MRFEHLRSEIERRLQRGESFESVEEGLIDRCEVPEDVKAALWLYGWCLVEAGERRDAVANVAPQGWAVGD